MRSFITHPPSCPRKAGIQGARRGFRAPGPCFRARACTHVRLVPVLSRALAPLRPLAGGEGGAPARPRREGEVGSSAVREGSPHLTPTLSAPKGGEGDIPARLSGCEICACPSASAGVTKSGCRSLPFGSPGPAKQRETAAEQRDTSLFFRWPNRRRPRVPAEDVIPFADNFLQEQQKQREAGIRARRRHRAREPVGVATCSAEND